MADIDFIRIGELDPLSTPDDSLAIPVEIAGETKRITLAALKDYIFNDTELSGVPTAPSPNPGADNQQIATTAYVQDELSGLGLGAATSTTPGVVRTNANEAAPIVYLKTSVDALLNTVRPVNLGGTGATTAADARTNLVAAQSGANNDITSLGALSSVPSVVTTAISNGANMPVGSLIMWPSASMPSSKWLLCDGSPLSTTTYSALFGVLGTTFGGNGTTTFNLPNFLGRSPIGAGVSAASGTNRAIGITGGADTRALTVSEMPAHTHGGVIVAAASAPGFASGVNLNLQSGNTASNGSGQAFGILHPFIAINFIIKALP